MFGDLKNKITQAKEDLNVRMNDAQVRANSSSQLISVIANGNREIIDLQINHQLLDDSDQLEDELLITINRALEKATILYDAELKEVMKNNMPAIPGLDGLLD